MDENRWIRWLGEPNTEAASIDLVGGKGANLGRLLRLGFPVPPGFVITTAAYRAFLEANQLEGLETMAPVTLQARILQAPMPDDLGDAIRAAYQRVDARLVAVRSSGTAEDLATASFAGQHDTFLNVTGSDALLDAVQACWASLWTPRAIAYRRQSGWRDVGAAPLALAVVVQTMAQAEAAGVAFTANPITGDRAETTISAVRGLGERLVSGEGVAEEWVVRGAGADTTAICQRGSEQAMTSEQALAVADMARQIAERFGAPQDVEWAIEASGKLYVLQARPMTALPTPSAPDVPSAPVSWRSPVGGGWMRNFRLGEWLPEPVTPLCESWLLNRIEQGEVDAEERDFGLRPRPPYHVLANGWYFSSPIGSGVPVRGVVTALTRHPRQIAALALSTVRPDLAERAFIGAVAHRWQADLLPHYQRLVADWEARLDSASSAELIKGVDAIAGMAGAFLWDLSVVGGHAWKSEHALARFCRQRLLERVASGHQELLLGLPVRLPPPYPAAPAHAVQSLDWIRPTLGTSPASALTTDDLAERRARMAQERHKAEVACRSALASQPRQLRRFNALLALAQRYAILREEQAGWFTLGWPCMRRAVLRLGDELQSRGQIEHVEDVFFLTRGEVEMRIGRETAQAAGYDGVVTGALQAAIATRRSEWERQRRLSPPLTLGNPLGARMIARATEAMRTPAAPGAIGATRASGHGALKGMPASPGRATGPTRVIREPEDFERFLPGEVLVAQVTAPAWTALFGRAAAVVTDGGSLAAHASLVAREYGIPAVVATGDATTRLHDGQVVTVDGSAGVVEFLA
jgi:pyruvate,water dikinase